MNTVRPEVSLLLACARTCLDAQGTSRIKSHESIEWAYLIRMARGHGVNSLVWSGVI